MKILRWPCIVITVLWICSCAPTTQQQTTVPADSPGQATAPTSTATIELPCAEAQESDQPTILYPVGSLYRSGAVLPSEEGLTCMDVLSDWLKNSATNDWLVDVGGEDGSGFDPEKLAGKRQELLQRYFQRKGLDTSAWNWQTFSSQKVQLQFTGSP